MIENVKQQDLPACLKVIHTACGTAAKEFGLTRDNCPTNGAFMPLSRLQAEFAAASGSYAYREDGRILGFAMLCPRQEGAFKLEKLAVLPEARRRGIFHVPDMALLSPREQEEQWHSWCDAYFAGLAEEE